MIHIHEGNNINLMILRIVYYFTNNLLCNKLYITNVLFTEIKYYILKILCNTCKIALLDCNDYKEIIYIIFIIFITLLFERDIY